MVLSNVLIDIVNMDDFEFGNRYFYIGELERFFVLNVGF